MGTTVPTFPSGVSFDNLTWEPDLPLIERPNLLQRIFTTFSPDTFLNSGIGMQVGESELAHNSLATSNVVNQVFRFSLTGNSSKYSSVASLRLETASSIFLPWLNVPISGHSATYISSSLCKTAVKVYIFESL